MPGLWRFPILVNLLVQLVPAFLPTLQSFTHILPGPLRSRMLRSSKLVLNACQKNVKRNEISWGALTEINDDIKNVEINEIRQVNIRRDRASDWIEAVRETSGKRDDDENDDDEGRGGDVEEDTRDRDEVEASSINSENFPLPKPRLCFSPINGFSSKTGLKFALF